MVAVPPLRSLELLEQKPDAQRSTHTSPEPPHELRDLWVWLVTRWRSVSRALAACHLLEADFGELELQQLWRHARGGNGQDFKRLLDSLLPSFSPRSMRLPRPRLLEQFASCAPRVSFRHWSNTVLLSYDRLSDLAFPFRSGGRCLPREPITFKEAKENVKGMAVSQEDFFEALALQEVCLEDSSRWLEALRRESKSALDFELLLKRIIDQRVTLESFGTEHEFSVGEQPRPPDCLPLEDIAVRLIYSFGDLTAAFNLLPKASQVNQTHPRVGSPKLRSLSPKAPRLPGQHLPRKVELAQEQFREDRLSDVYTLTDRQWLHALRGAEHTRLLSETDAKAEAARQVKWQAQRAKAARARGIREHAMDVLQTTFPNLTERLCIAKTGFQPYEAMVVRVSLTAHGFFGHRMARKEALTANASARHFTPGNGAPSLFGEKPFLAVVPLGTEKDLEGDASGVEFQAALEKACPQGTARALLRAPASASGGRDGLWALQLCASEDGLTPLATRSFGLVGPPLPFRVVPRRPGRPSAPFVTATSTIDTVCSLTVGWREPLDEGGAPVQGHDLRLWEKDHHVRGEEPLVFSGDDVWPEFHLEGVQPGTDYVLQVRCYNEAGASEWSATSEPLTTAELPPPDLGVPEVVDVGLGFVTLHWTTFSVDFYEVEVDPLTSGEDPWITCVEPPAVEAAHKEAITKTEAKIAGLQQRQMYRFRVRGKKSGNVGPWSGHSGQVYTSALGAIASAPSAPKQLEPFRDGMVLAWDPPAEAEAVIRYLIKAQAECPGKPEKEELQFQTPGASTRYKVRGLRGNACYTFRVQALTPFGLSAPSEPAQLSTSARMPRPPKTLAVAHAAQTAMTLRWEAPDDDGGAPVETYILEVVDGSNPAYRLVKEFSGQDVEGSVDGLQGNNRYFFRLSAVSAAGTSRAAELLASSGPVPPGPPGLPRLLGDASATCATLAWSAPLDNGGGSILAYSLQWSLCGSDCEYFALDVTGTKGTAENLLPDSRYKFRVCARNAAGMGRPSEWWALCTAPSAPPAPPKPSAVAASSTSIEVTWGEALLPDAQQPFSWEVVAMELDRPGQEDIVRCKAPPILVKSLARFTSYAFRVRAMGQGGWSEWSEPSDPSTTSEEWSDEEIVDFLLPKFGGSLANVFRGLDTNCDGFIGQEDLARGLENLGLQLSAERVARLFADLDAQHRGLCTLRDFSKCLSPTAAPSRVAATRRSARCHTSPARIHGCGSAKIAAVQRSSATLPLPEDRVPRQASFELTYVSPKFRK